MSSKVTLHTLLSKKQRGEKIACLTAYDHPFARLADGAGVDLILVGDSLGMAFRGEGNTLTVTVDDMAYHTRAVRRGVTRAMLVADMPFMSYHVSAEEAVRNAGALVAAGAEGVKVEGGGGDVRAAIGKMVAAGIPVMGHLGLTPQSVHQLGGYRFQGGDAQAARRIEEEAALLAEAGCFAVVLECVPAELAARVSAALPVPVIGIGAGPSCDGQILVITDLLGLNPDFRPRFVKQYADLASVVTGAVEGYVAETRTGAFPAEEHTFGAKRRLKAI